MNPAASTHARPARRLLAGAIGCLLLAVTLTYWQSFRGPLVFDDLAAIQDNPTLRHAGQIFFPPAGDGVTVGGRPVLNASLALNYGLGGLNPWGYHAFNLLIHALSALLIFGLVRRTLLLPVVREKFAGASISIAFFTALLWALHPLQTEAVTYIIQRAESLAGFFYLLTLYCFVRSTESVAPRRWLTASVAACLLGMGTKEIVASAPLLVLFYDRTLITGSFRNAWRQRKGFYAALAATWLLLAILIVATNHRGGTAGFGLEVTPWNYLLTQCRAIIHYLALTFWPCPLIFDYGMIVIKNPAEVIGQGLLLIALLVATVIALVRRPAMGLLGLFFFAVLAPSSSFVPVASQTIAEHRMYLPLAAMVLSVVLGGYQLLGRRSFLLWPLAAFALCMLTVQRNADYRTALTLWGDTVEKLPGNARAQSNLSALLLQAGNTREALAHARAAVHLSPDYAEAQSNLGFALAADDSAAEEALQHFEQALRFKPESPVILNNAGIALAKLHRLEEAEVHYKKALALNPNYAPAHNNLGNLIADQGHPAEAIAHYQKALALDPAYAEAAYNLGSTWLEMNQLPAAIAELEHALQLRPAYAEAHYALGNALASAHRPDEAAAHYQSALHVNPAFAEAQNNWGSLLLQQGRAAEAIPHYEAAVKIRPTYGDALNNLGNALIEAGRDTEAIARYEAAIVATIRNADAHYNLGNVFLARRQLTNAAMHYEAALRQKATAGAEHNLALALAGLGRINDALPHFQAALQLAPDSAEAHHNYARALAQVGRVTEAISEDQTALRLQPDFPAASEHLRFLLR